MYLTSLGESIFRLVVVFAIFIGVLVITVFATKWIAGYQKNLAKNTNFDVVDALSIGTNQRLMIVKIGKDRYFAIGVGKEEVTLISELSEEELLKRESSDIGNKKNFSEIFDKLNSQK